MSPTRTTRVLQVGGNDSEVFLVERDESQEIHGVKTG